MNNPIVRIPIELLLTILLVLLVFDAPKQDIIEKEFRSTDSFCDCDMDKPEFRAVKVKYNLSEENYKAAFKMYQRGKVEHVKAIPPDAVSMKYVIFTLLYMLCLILLSWFTSDWRTYRVILPISDFIIFIARLPYAQYKKYVSYKDNLNKSTYTGLSSAISDINKFLKG